MYICICKAVTDHQIQDAINAGICTRKQLVQCFGLGGDCGKCNKDIKDILKAHCLPQASNQDTLLPTIIEDYK